ncbi:MAG: ABC transporter substrate-binding protein [Thermodesulfobacteriota bacterium]|nr:ABC transporter substrate-binding protein [Thermodesulfobacteriota bacterium]
MPAQFKDADGFWTGFAARARVLVYNTDLLEESGLPVSIFDLTEPGWKGRVAMGYPLFGTTATHVAALWAHLGPDKTKEYLKALKANEIVIVDGNAVVSLKRISVLQPGLLSALLTPRQRSGFSLTGRP